MNVQLVIAMGSRRDVWPIFDGSVKAEGIDLIPIEVSVPELHYRQFRYAEFDCSELGVISLLGNDQRWVGIPVFPSRRFFHTRILVRRDAGIDKPSDLKGKQVGVPSIWMSAVMWTLGPLRDEFGVEPRDMEFWVERDPDEWHDTTVQVSDPSRQDRRPPEGVTLHVIPKTESTASLILAGKLDAALQYIGPELGPNIVERGTVDLRTQPEIKPLFPDPVGEGIRYFRKTGLYPINHTVVIKREIVEKYPWLPLNLFKCFQEANAIMTRQRIDQTRFHVETGLISRETGAALREPVVKYGLEPNRTVLEQYARYAYEFGSTSRRVKIDDIFVPSTRGA